MTYQSLPKARANSTRSSRARSVGPAVAAEEHPGVLELPQAVGGHAGVRRPGRQGDASISVTVAGAWPVVPARRRRRRRRSTSRGGRRRTRRRRGRRVAAEVGLDGEGVLHAVGVPCRRPARLVDLGPPPAQPRSATGRTAPASGGRGPAPAAGWPGGRRRRPGAPGRRPARRRRRRSRRGRDGAPGIAPRTGGPHRARSVAARRRKKCRPASRRRRSSPDRTGSASTTGSSGAARVA